MNPYYLVAVARADNRCEYCRAPERVFNHSLEVDHITPISAGGRDEFANLAVACRPCNGYKSNVQFALDPRTCLEVPLYHPRMHRWHEHFLINPISGEFFGITPTGRATIERLQLNHPRQLTAREYWIKLNLFP